MKIVMPCGHGVERNPVGDRVFCHICGLNSWRQERCLEPEVLTGRDMRCVYCEAVRPAHAGAMGFRHRPDLREDEFTCEKHGCD
jgi:hypothetical protein